MIVASTSDIKRATDRGYRALAALDQHVTAFKAANPVLAQAAASTVAVGSDSAPVVQVVNLLLAQALRDRASDVHVEPMGETVRVRFRIDRGAQLRAALDAAGLPVETIYGGWNREPVGHPDGEFLVVARRR